MSIYFLVKTLKTICYCICWILFFLALIEFKYLVTGRTCLLDSFAPHFAAALFVVVVVVKLVKTISFAKPNSFLSFCFRAGFSNCST